MNLVAWNSAIQIRKRVATENVCTAGALWYQVASPTSHQELVGNGKAIRQIEDWFSEASAEPETSACLFLHGESGTGKSTAVTMIAQKHEFKTVTTYADRSRTPARLEGVVREAGVHGPRGVVVLDDFEIFLEETTSLRVLSKLLRQLLSTGDTSVRNRSRCLFIIISNSKHKQFGSLQDISTTIHFERLHQSEINKVFNRLAWRVRRHSYVPPMASYLSSISSSGTITQGVQQLQLLYAGDTPPDFLRRPGRKKQKIAGHTNSHRDCISYLWSDIYTDKILEHLVDNNFHEGRVIDRLRSFERERLDKVGGQLHEEYARRMTSVEQLRDVAESISMSDTNRLEFHHDALYDGENSDSWSENDMAFVSFVAYGVLTIKGQRRRDQSWSRKTHTRLLKCEALVL
ncbi:unnamed protein product [Ectocarpus sp. 6 AP-2014]|uniref:EsV-1-138 n=1 Tax=Ectocarpus siliculosus TaxID=2880 RepID=D8LPG4_ECTSI|nr:EsV-1-138 [Ectocarpus siliculosus]|eukprot:CBN80436.1 EsV-1-138 [Ectocarpus siliculosus]